ncbi:MAG: arabinose isomerase, partial [Lentisphaeria bacterium]|nr:arabinose isomerase [Lentisphaeria bacterium]
MQIPRRKPLAANVALLSVGLDTYWKQFPGLLEELMGKSAKLAKKLAANAVTVTDLGMIDNSAKAYDALPKILAADPDVVFVDMVT